MCAMPPPALVNFRCLVPTPGMVEACALGAKKVLAVGTEVHGAAPVMLISGRLYQALAALQHEAASRVAPDGSRVSAVGDSHVKLVNAGLAPEAAVGFHMLARKVGASAMKPSPARIAPRVVFAKAAVHLLAVQAHLHTRRAPHPLTPILIARLDVVAKRAGKAHVVWRRHLRTRLACTLPPESRHRLLARSALKAARDAAHLHLMRRVPDHAGVTQAHSRARLAGPGGRVTPRRWTAAGVDARELTAHGAAQEGVTPGLPFNLPGCHPQGNGLRLAPVATRHVKAGRGKLFDPVTFPVRAEPKCRLQIVDNVAVEVAQKLARKVPIPGQSDVLGTHHLQITVFRDSVPLISTHSPVESE